MPELALPAPVVLFSRHNSGMSRRSWSSRIALWAAICALLLKAAMPVLATGAAKAHNVPVADICSVYGVALRPVSDAGPDQYTDHRDHEDRGSHPGDQHASDHCVLTALGALAPHAGTPPRLWSSNEPDVYQPSGTTCSPTHDACAVWAARMQHGPPAFA